MYAAGDGSRSVLYDCYFLLFAPRARSSLSRIVKADPRWRHYRRHSSAGLGLPAAAAGVFASKTRFLLESRCFAFCSRRAFDALEKDRCVSFCALQEADVSAGSCRCWKRSSDDMGYWRLASRRLAASDRPLGESLLFCRGILRVAAGSAGQLVLLPQLRWKTLLLMASSSLPLRRARRAVCGSSCDLLTRRLQQLSVFSKYFLSAIDCFIVELIARSHC